MEINELSHKNSIWTWFGSKVSVWLPYLQSISKEKGGWLFKYNGGEIKLDLKKVESVLFYGASCDLPLQILDDFNKHGIIAILHRRGVAAPYVFHSLNLKDTSNDILTKQILFRENKIKRNFIAKSLIRERLRSMQWLIDIPESHFQNLRAEKDYKKIIGLEAKHSNRYWSAFSDRLGLSEWKRREEHPVSAALDACSYFMVTIIIRWTLFHKLSPSHSYLHRPTTYASLAYDLIEPYRYIFEQSVLEAYEENGEENLIENSISVLKLKLLETTYIPSQKGYVKRKNLLHGVVLALRAYLIGKSKLIVIPVEGEKKGGRPVNSGYLIPGMVEKPGKNK